MPRNKNLTLQRKSILIGLIVAGSVFISLAVLPDFLSSGEKGFGFTQLFFLRNGIFIFVTGLVLSLFPGILNYFKQTFSDNEYVEERLQRQGKFPFTKYDFIMLILFLIAANFFAIYFIGKENTIYDWDSAHFWGKSAEMTRIFNVKYIYQQVSVLAFKQKLNIRVKIQLFIKFSFRSF